MCVIFCWKGGTLRMRYDLHPRHTSRCPDNMFVGYRSIRNEVTTKRKVRMQWTHVNAIQFTGEDLFSSTQTPIISGPTHRRAFSLSAPSAPEGFGRAASFGSPQICGLKNVRWISKGRLLEKCLVVEVIYCNPLSTHILATRSIF